MEMQGKYGPQCTTGGVERRKKVLDCWCLRPHKSSPQLDTDSFPELGAANGREGWAIQMKRKSNKQFSLVLPRKTLEYWWQGRGLELPDRPSGGSCWIAVETRQKFLETQKATLSLLLFTSFHRICFGYFRQFFYS